MSADLRTLLDDAVVGTELDVDAALSRGRRLRRRRAAARAASVLALVAVAAAGLPQLQRGPTAPVIGAGPDVAEQAYPLLAPSVVDGVLRVEVDVADLPDALPGEGVPLAVRDVLSVGADGTVLARTAADGRATDGLWAQNPDGAVAQLVEGVAVAAAVRTTDGTVVAVGTRRDTPVVVAVGSGGAVEEALAPSLDLSDASAITQLVVTADGVDVAVHAGGDGAGATVRRVRVWEPGGPVVSEPTVQPATTDVPWPLSQPLEGGVDDVLAVDADGAVLEVVVRGGSGPTGGQSRRVETAVVGGVRTGTALADRADGTAVPLGLAAGPAAADVLVVPLPATTVGAGLDGVGLHADTAGDLWAITTSAVAGTRLHRVAEAVPWAEPVVATLPDAGPRVPGPFDGGVVVAPDAVGTAPTTPAARSAGRDLYDAGDLRLGPAVLAAVAPDGTAALHGADGLVLDAAGDGSGAVAEVATGQLWGLGGGTAGPGVAFDASGNLWGLADRWWSGARYPDLVVHRPGAPGFTSLGHVRVRHLLGVDADEVVLHVQGDEVALVAGADPRNGTLPSWRRVVVARDGERVDDLSVRRLPGPGASSGQLRGPFVPGDRHPGRLQQEDVQGQVSGARLDGGIVLRGTTVRSGPALVLAVAPDGTTLAVAVPPTAGGSCASPCDEAPVAAADGSVWLLRDGALTQLVDGQWRPVASGPGAAGSP